LITIIFSIASSSSSQATKHTDYIMYQATTRQIYLTPKKCPKYERYHATKLAKLQNIPSHGTGHQATKFPHQYIFWVTHFLFIKLTKCEKSFWDFPVHTGELFKNLHSSLLR
jgi:hypothetical protein